jgi:hypothetical protein
VTFLLKVFEEMQFFWAGNICCNIENEISFCQKPLCLLLFAMGGVLSGDDWLIQAFSFVGSDFLAFAFLHENQVSV